ncbi:glucosamine-6-phosphate deaminase [Bacillus sp. SORGH_AS 510]|uniref:glucosamine-6-phosphate deaminase n=1 Tax=Bacillus sp. SORGH_AS_0510 TaxID=3041771 RepID=UPI002787FB69|nr:glucosamine-6-phosphate deaminase [Bacillus sp. SORGH_AS_0510]MDQ1143969.1 glucosamine-6-phosphate deaminase [Bacillus sp. SORGH_AS_0510]
MKIIHVKNYEEMSQKAAEYLIEKIRRNPAITLGLATGGTPVGLYDELVKDHQTNQTSYQDVTTFNLDEYMGLSGEDPNSYRYFMNQQLFNRIDIPKANTHVPLGDTKDPQQQCSDYETLLKNHGGIDLQILGIGSNGHIGFNEPGTSFQSETHIVELAPTTREANARFFNSLNEVPTQAITMGIASILRSKEILLLISGENKQDALAKLIHGEVSEDFPASVLRNHPHVTIIADEAAIGTIVV